MIAVALAAIVLAGVRAARAMAVEFGSENLLILLFVYACLLTLASFCLYHFAAALIRLWQGRARPRDKSTPSGGATMPSLSRAEARAVDAWAAKTLGLPTLVLMENAGRGAAEWLRELAGDGVRVLVVCGWGNNGGDGGVVARRWDLWGFPVRVVWTSTQERCSDDASIQYGALKNLGINQRNLADSGHLAELESLLAEADWVVDGLFGTGLARPVEGWMRAVIEAMNRSGKPILALDVPSGLDADTGQPLGVAVRARATATFVAPKLGFSAPGTSAFTGEVKVIDIGIPDRRPGGTAPGVPVSA